MGSGPWYSGLWWGDSQLGIAAMWIAHAAAAHSWGGHGALPLDYYMYSAFTENPSNQCFVHANSAARRAWHSAISPPFLNQPSGYLMMAFSKEVATLVCLGPATVGGKD